MSSMDVRPGGRPALPQVPSDLGRQGFAISCTDGGGNLSHPLHALPVRFRAWARPAGNGHMMITRSERVT